MNFDVYGGFEIYRKQNRHGLFDEDFWARVASTHSELPSACGCYIFAVRNGQNTVAWYVGKTERNTFRKECFEPTKINYYNEVLVDRRGAPVLFLLPRLTASRTRFSRPAKNGHRDIEFLETMLIGLVLERNSQLMNIKKTKMLREMVVPGIVNSPQARPSNATLKLKNALGLNA